MRNREITFSMVIREIGKEIILNTTIVFAVGLLLMIFTDGMSGEHLFGATTILAIIGLSFLGVSQKIDRIENIHIH